MYETECGYQVYETLGGLEVYENDCLVCTLDGRTLSSYCDEETDKINNDALEQDIEEMIEVENFLAYQNEFC